MKRKIFLFGATLILAGIVMWGCSSDNNNGSSAPDLSDKVPTNTDSGKNNNSEPDNINPSNPGNSDNNTGSGDNNTGSGDDNTGSGDNNTGSGDDNTGSGDNNTGSGDNNTGSGSTTPTWNLVFEDNFGDSSDNTVTYPSTEYWTLAAKGTDTWNRHMSESYNQAFIKGGYLYLYGEEVDGEYLTGGIESRNKFDFKYGQVKCRARFLRQPQGNHTGIWMMPQQESHGAWPRSGEIDIMEHLDDQPVYYSTVHYWDEGKGEDGSSDKEINVDHNEFNIYGVVWNQDAVAFTLNGEVMFTYKNADPTSDEFSYQYPFVDNFYLILSQSLGGKGTWEGVIDNSELPAIFQIDWIKVWQMSDEE